jgi:hypothetical protein
VSDARALPEPQFPTAGLGRVGYDVGQVDAFVDELQRSLHHDPPTMAPYEVADQRFRVRRWGRRYSMHVVDDYLDQAQQALRARHGADAVAGLEGHSAEPRHVSTWWIYLVAAVLIAGMVLFTLTQL